MEQRKKVRTTIAVINLADLLDGKNISQIIPIFDRKLYNLKVNRSDLKDENLFCNFDYILDDQGNMGHVFIIKHERLETDDEFNERVKLEEYNKQRYEIDERKELARLKEKYKND